VLVGRDTDHMPSLSCTAIVCVSLIFIRLLRA
jgi:hypothetical protein